MEQRGQRPGFGCRTCGCMEHVQVVSLAADDPPPDLAGKPTYQPTKNTTAMTAGSQSLRPCLRRSASFDMVLEMASGGFAKGCQSLPELCLVAGLLQLEGEELPPRV